jgi:ATP-dependent RNA helicase RhlE
MSFDALGLTPELLRAVADQGYTEPTPVQRESIPAILAGRDILAGAQTGTGKTAAFVLPMLQLLNGARTPGWKATAPADPRDRRPAPPPPVRALVLTPTRELCLQVEESVRVYGAHRRIRSVAIYGGVGYEPQNRALRAGPGIVVATPGRLLDHIGQGHIDLSRLEILVLDEADRMLDMGFIRDIRRVMELLPRDRQTLLFSATFSDDIRQLASGILRDPAMVQVTPRNTATELVTQLVHPVDRERKRELLSHLIRTGRIEQALVFTRTKHGANRLAEQLGRDGIAAAAIHGNKSQGQRVRALDDFKAGRAAILVATEVASRGLDIEDLPHVVNFELPLVAEDYVHRIGRTGRAGASGDAISLVCVDEAPLLRDIERLLDRRIPSEVIPGFEPDRSIRPEAIQRGGGNRGQRPMGRPQPRPMGHPTPRPAAGPGGSWASRPGQHAPATAAGRPAHHGPRQPLSAGPVSGPAQYRPGRRPGNAVGPRPPAAPVGFGNRPVANRAFDNRPGGDRGRPDRPGRGRPRPGAHVEAGSSGPRRGGPQPGRRPAGPNERPWIETLPGERLARHRPG